MCHFDELVAVYRPGIVIPQKAANSHQAANERTRERRRQDSGVRHDVQSAARNRATTGTLRRHHSDIPPVLRRELPPKGTLALAVLDPDRLRQTDAAPSSRAKSQRPDRAPPGMGRAPPAPPASAPCSPDPARLRVYQWCRGHVPVAPRVRRFARLDQVICRSARCLFQVVPQAPDCIYLAAGQALDLSGSV